MANWKPRLLLADISYFEFQLIVAIWRPQHALPLLTPLHVTCCFCKQQLAHSLLSPFLFPSLSHLLSRSPCINKPEPRQPEKQHKLQRNARKTINTIKCETTNSTGRWRSELFDFFLSFLQRFFGIRAAAAAARPKTLLLFSLFPFLGVGLI